MARRDWLDGVRQARFLGDLIGMALDASYRRLVGLLVSGGVPAFVLVLAGVAKLGDPFLAGLFLRFTLHLPLPVAFDAARGLALAEIVVGLAIAACIGRSVVPALAGVGLYAVFVGLLARLLATQPNAATCGCFGDLFSGAGQHHLTGQCTLDVLLATLLIVHVILSRRPWGAATGGP